MVPCYDRRKVGESAMDYLTSVQRTINYIEEHMQDHLTLERLADVACFSPFHFHRVFQAMVGESVMEYVRKRRLTSAAERLFYSEEKVIDIALDLGYHYHESFNRAFKKWYGVSPKQYRNLDQISGPLRGKAYLHPIRIGGRTMEPKHVTKPAFRLIGYELKTTSEDGQNIQDIPQFWQQYLDKNLGSTIPNPLKPKEEIGVCTDFCPETSTFSYVIGMEVTDETQTPEGLVSKQFSESAYAIFTTPKADEDCFPSTIQSTWQYIFTEWFPQSEYEHSGAAEFELYDERCHGPNDNQMDIYIPIKKRT